MGYQEMFREANEEVKERYALVVERIQKIPKEDIVPKTYREYFCQTAAFLCLIDEVLQKEETGALDNRTLEECRQTNRRLYEAILPSHYENSYANPQKAAAVCGKPFGNLLSFLYAELRTIIGYAFEGRKKPVAIFMELFAEIYGYFALEEDPKEKEVRDILYWFFYDYSEMFAEDQVRGMVDPDYDFFTKIALESDLTDLRYLYRYGAYIGDDEIEMAKFLNTLSQEEIDAMANTMTEGFRIGYENLGKDLSKKKTIAMAYPVGFERVVRAAAHNIEKLGLRPTIRRDYTSSFYGRNGRKQGCYATSANKQFEFDHKSDSAFYLDKKYLERYAQTLRAAFEAYQKQAKEHAGPARIEIFGEEPFSPEIKPDLPQYTDVQNALKVAQTNRLGQITNAYIPGDERSFTIIAYPIPAIGPKFQEIFQKTVEVNTLDYTHYRNVQQKMIDLLDQGTAVHVTGKGKNKTDLWIRLHPLRDKTSETAFENCVADVNIPVGEVFTTPVLKGTCGKLHVTRVYLNEFPYFNLELDFTDGMIEGYTCTNFPTEEENRNFIYENLLRRHKTLPMGEFAIGTNTTAYRMARDYAMEDKLPILIAEKTGPHFAIGDTCYSHAEDTKVYNPDGKEIIARDNAISLLRKEDMDNAYFHCHTDITIPYDELDAITVTTQTGDTIDLIKNGRFVAEGTESLNLPLDK